MERAGDHAGQTADRAVSRAVLASGFVAAPTAVIAAFVIFWFVPLQNSPDAVRELTDFYADSGNRMLILVAEPLALISTAAFALFTAGLAARLTAAGDARRASLASVGGGIFAALFLVAMVANTVLAGTLAFAKAFTFDAGLAMVLSHFGYVTLAGAMAAGAVVAGATGASMREGRLGSPRLGTFGYVVAALSVLAIFFVYLPLLVFAVWIVLIAWEGRTPRRPRG